MKRAALTNSLDSTRLEREGFIFHNLDGQYWNNKAYYIFSSQQCEVLKSAAEEVHQMCLAAVEHIVKSGDYEPYALSAEAFGLASESWLRKDPHLYGRFDFAWNGSGAPKLLEYNADTPTSLLEAGKVQRAWLNSALNSDVNIFNNIADLLSRRFSELIPTGKNLFVSCLKDNVEDEGNVLFMQERAILAGVDAKFCFIEDLVWEADSQTFCDRSGVKIDYLFKLYPWEWLVRDEYSSVLGLSQTKFIEPAWKMLLSNKALLAVLWKLFPNHPNLLQASFSADEITSQRLVTKPILGREGANVTIMSAQETIAQSGGAYQNIKNVYQEYYEVPCLDSHYATLGLWMIADQCAGMGIREDTSLITKNTSLFVPHVVE
jgi:glutathionylspermidine synthase